MKKMDLVVVSVLNISLMNQLAVVMLLLVPNVHLIIIMKKMDHVAVFVLKRLILKTL